MPFLQSTDWRYTLIKKTIKFSLQIRQLQAYCHNKLYRDKARVWYMRRYWHKEIIKYRDISAGSPLAADKATARRINAFDQVAGEYLIRKLLNFYLERCKYIHALAFYQHRAVKF